MIRYYADVRKFFKSNERAVWHRQQIIEELDRIYLELALEYDADKIKMRELDRLTKLMAIVNLPFTYKDKILEAFEKL